MTILEGNYRYVSRQSQNTRKYLLTTFFAISSHLTLLIIIIGHELPDFANCYTHNTYIEVCEVLPWQQSAIPQWLLVADHRR